MYKKHRKLIQIFLELAVISFVLLACVTPMEENDKFEQDTFINVQKLRNQIGHNSNIDRSSSYFSYGITTGEIVFRLNKDLPVELYFIEDKEELTEEKKHHKNIVEVNVDNAEYHFNDDENTLWLAGLLSVLSYAQSDYLLDENSVEVFSEEDSSLSLGYTTGLDKTKAGRIFMNTLHSYTDYEKERLAHLVQHPIIKDYYTVLETREEKRLDHFYESLFEVTSHSLKIVYDTSMLEEILKKDIFIESDFLIDDPLALPTIIKEETETEEGEEPATEE